MSECACAQCGRLARALCQQGAGVGRQPCIAQCPSAWPSVCRLRPLCANATQSWGARGERGVRRGERGLKGINHGRETRAGGRRMEGCRGGETGEGDWLAAHVHPPLPPSSLPLPCFFYLLSVPMLMSCDVRGGRERRQAALSEHPPPPSCLFSGQ